MKFLKVIIILSLLSNYLHAQRASIMKEYVMMKLCIKDKDDLFTDYIEARDNCACAIGNLSYSIINKINKKERGNKIWITMKSELERNYERCEN